MIGTYGNFYLANGDTELTLHARRNEVFRFHLANACNPRVLNLGFLYKSADGYWVNPLSQSFPCQDGNRRPSPDRMDGPWRTGQGYYHIAEHLEAMMMFNHQVKAFPQKMKADAK
jgi:hypothetical protein